MGFAYFCPLKVGRRKAKPCTTPRLLANPPIFSMLKKSSFPTFCIKK